MKLTIQDKLALMMTSAGSQRNLSAFIGISHQRIGRWLRYGYEGGAKRLPDDPAIVSAIDAGFEIHTDLCRDQARADGLPFNPRLPTYTFRLLKQKKKRIVTDDGEIIYRPLFDSKGKPILEKGDRVSIGNTHWLSNRIRDAVIAGNQKTGKYYHVSVGSMVNLQIYNKRAEDRFKGVRRTPEQRRYREQFKNKIAQGIDRSWVFTRYVPLPPSVAPDLIADAINDQLIERHEPATGDPGTALAAQILFQVDTRDNANPPQAKRATKRRKRRN